MIGNRVRIMLDPTLYETGTLQSLDAAGVTFWKEHSPPDGESHIKFIPLRRIHEIIDLGRAQ